MADGYVNESYNRCIAELRARYNGRGVSVNAKRAAADQIADESARALAAHNEGYVSFNPSSGVSDEYRSGEYKGGRYRGSAENLLLIFDNNGHLKLTLKIGGSVSDVKMNEKYVYLLCDDKIIRVDSTFGHTSAVEFSEEDARLTLLSGGELLACTPSLAYYVSFN